MGKDMSETGTAKTDLATADIMRVLQLLPHRYPFLLVDRIFDMKADESAVGVKSVTFNEPFFQGHFPNFPIMPGVLIIEGMAQTAGALCVNSLAGAAEYKPQLVYFMGIDRAKFRKPVVPGDQLHLSRAEDPQPRPGLAVQRSGQGQRPDRGRGRDQRHDPGSRRCQTVTSTRRPSSRMGRGSDPTFASAPTAWSAARWCSATGSSC